MSNELKKTDQAHHLDGFDGFTDEVEGGDEQSLSGIYLEGFTKFTNDYKWTNAAGEELPDIERIVIDIDRGYVKWGPEAKPIESVILAKGQKWPDIKAMNEAAPSSEWREDPNGKKVGPYQAQCIVYLRDLVSMEKFTYPTGTVGGGIAVRTLIDRVEMMRRFNGPNVYPIVRLRDTYMPTRYSKQGRQRPHFEIVRWILLDGGYVTALPAPDAPALAEPTVAQPATPKEPLDQFAAGGQPQQGTRIVTPPTAKEATGDEIPF